MLERRRFSLSARFLRTLGAGTAALGLSLLPGTSPALAQSKGLDIYFVDTEGGAATLLVTPAGESVLIDTGNAGTRDAERIHKVATQVARLKQIDILCTTHWHNDHYGGVGHLSTLMPIKKFYDRGIPAETLDDPQNFPTLIAAYKKASGGKSIALKPDDTLPLRQSNRVPLVLRCVCSSNAFVPDKPGAKTNLVANENTPKPLDTSDNAQSLGFVLSYGDFRFLDLGDLTWNQEYKLVSPTDKLGKIDVYQSTHHGLDQSNNTVVLKTVMPTVVIFNNGPHKGANPSVMSDVKALSSVKAIFQQHKNLDAPEVNTTADHIANLDENCQAEYIKVSIAPNGESYTVTVGSKGKPVRFATRTTKMNTAKTQGKK